jgi:hypothetical protein
MKYTNRRVVTVKKHWRILFGFSSAVSATAWPRYKQVQATLCFSEMEGWRENLGSCIKRDNEKSFP